MSGVNHQQGDWSRRLEKLGLAVRRKLIEARAGGADMATPVAQEGGDTIFAIDRHVEAVIESEIAAWPAECLPVLLIAEGMGEDGRHVIGGHHAPPRYRLIVDPIDGTRNIMYDKRAAWFLAAVAHNKGDATRLSDSIASAMVELPTSKAAWADSFTAEKGGRVVAIRRAVDDEDNARQFEAHSSNAPTLKNGFGQVSNFFPGTKVLASELMERIVEATLGQIEPGSASVFDDQYITTGGQLIELMVGHDRFICDLRPLFYDILGKRRGNPIRGLECHPYDMAGLLVAQAAGVIVTDGLGRPLDAPLDVHSGVHWCGYANATLRSKIEPVIQAWMHEHGVGPRPA